MQVKKGNFVELDYTGKLKEENIIFDTTSATIAKQAGIFNSETNYKPVIVCVGQKHVLAGMDKVLEEAEIGKEKTIEVAPEEGFGKKRADAIQLIATSKFRKHGINPVPGLQVNVDNSFGVIKTVTGGRTMVDFNHPCAGKVLTYTFTIKRIVENVQEKVKALLTQLFSEAVIEEVVVNENKAKISIKFELPMEIREKCTKKIIELVPDIKEVLYDTKT